MYGRLGNSKFGGGGSYRRLVLYHVLGERTGPLFHISLQEATLPPLCCFILCTGAREYARRRRSGCRRRTRVPGTPHPAPARSGTAWLRRHWRAQNGIIAPRNLFPQPSPRAWTGSILSAGPFRQGFLPISGGGAADLIVNQQVKICHKFLGRVSGLRAEPAF